MASNGPKNRSHSGGHDKGTRQSRVSLAAYFRERFPMEVVADIYEQILSGKQPKVDRVADDEECHPNCECGLKVIGEVAYVGQAPTLDQKLLVLARIKERSYGQPAQHMHIEAEIKAEVSAIVGGVDPAYFGKLSPKALESIRNAVLRLDTSPPIAGVAAENRGIIDAEFVDLPDDSNAPTD